MKEAGKLAGDANTVRKEPWDVSGAARRGLLKEVMAELVSSSRAKWLGKHLS